MPSSLVASFNPKPNQHPPPVVTSPFRAELLYPRISTRPFSPLVGGLWLPRRDPPRLSSVLCGFADSRRLGLSPPPRPKSTPCHLCAAGILPLPALPPTCEQVDHSARHTPRSFRSPHPTARGPSRYPAWQDESSKPIGTHNSSLHPPWRTASRSSPASGPRTRSSWARVVRPLSLSMATIRVR